jgi:mannose-6-phosphate isomerase-like protein (cupin superfamily)
MTAVRGVRLVETGLDAAGRSTVVSDRVVDARELPTGRVLHPLWQDDAVLDAPPAGAEPGLFPAAGGARFWLFTVAAHEAQTGHALHATSTVDLGFVVSGVLTMELEDGSTVDLEPGDAYVQNGASHGWHNYGDVDATIALFIIGH